MTPFPPVKEVEATYAAFLQSYPEFEHTHRLDDLRAAEYARLDARQHVYLDYTGAGLYADSQLSAHMALLRERVLGNPHSSNPSSAESTELVEHTRRYILEFFNASPDEYCAIFTPNASGALKLVGESYPFGPGDHFLLTFDNHNSVNGIREYARARGAETTYVPLVLPEMRVDGDTLDDYLKLARPGGHNLFAYPAQSNFSGVQHSLDWIARAQAKGWEVLLDAAAFVSTNRLDLGRWQADFVPLSFYKMFGYPTGVGCLLARRQALAKLRRPWFAGGTITVASVQGDRYYFAEGEAAFEDGTLNYEIIPAVEIGLKHLEAIGIETIHERVRCLTGWLLDNLLSLHYANGKPLVRVYGPARMEGRGGTLTVNFYDRHGALIDHETIEQRANAANISLRTGCFCNPGGGELALGLSKTELVACFNEPEHHHHLTQQDFRHCIDGKSTGAVRLSLGLASNFADVQRFVEFARRFVE
jgi:selenocysteine lyase/cysteine desulfurase